MVAWVSNFTSVEVSSQKTMAKRMISLPMVAWPGCICFLLFVSLSIISCLPMDKCTNLTVERLALVLCAQQAVELVGRQIEHEEVCVDSLRGLQSWLVDKIAAFNRCESKVDAQKSAVKEENLDTLFSEFIGLFRDQQAVCERLTLVCNEAFDREQPGGAGLDRFSMMCYSEHQLVPPGSQPPPTVKHPLGQRGSGLTRVELITSSLYIDCAVRQLLVWGRLAYDALDFSKQVKLFSQAKELLPRALKVAIAHLEGDAAPPRDAVPRLPDLLKRASGIEEIEAAIAEKNVSEAISLIQKQFDVADPFTAGAMRSEHSSLMTPGVVLNPHQGLTMLQPEVLAGDPRAGSSAINGPPRLTIHVAMAYGMIFYSHLYSSHGAMRPAKSCADIAVLVAQQVSAGQDVTILVAAHQNRASVLSAMGQPSAAAEDVNIVLQLTQPSATTAFTAGSQNHSGPVSAASIPLLKMRALALVALAEALVNNAGVVDESLRRCAFKATLADGASQDKTHSTSTPASGRIGVVVQSLRESVQSALKAAEQLNHMILGDRGTRLDVQAIARTVRIEMTRRMGPADPQLWENTINNDASIDALQASNVTNRQLLLQCLYVAEQRSPMQAVELLKEFAALSRKEAVPRWSAKERRLFTDSSEMKDVHALLTARSLMYGGYASAAYKLVDERIPTILSGRSQDAFYSSLALDYVQLAFDLCCNLGRYDEAKQQRIAQAEQLSASRSYPYGSLVVIAMTAKWHQCIGDHPQAVQAAETLLTNAERMQFRPLVLEAHFLIASSRLARNQDVGEWSNSAKSSFGKDASTATALHLQKRNSISSEVRKGLDALNLMQAEMSLHQRLRYHTMGLWKVAVAASRATNDTPSSPTLMSSTENEEAQSKRLLDEKLRAVDELKHLQKILNTASESELRGQWFLHGLSIHALVSRMEPAGHDRLSKLRCDVIKSCDDSISSSSLHTEAARRAVYSRFELEDSSAVEVVCESLRSLL